VCLCLPTWVGASTKDETGGLFSRYIDSLDNSVEENYSILSVVRTCWLLSARHVGSKTLHHQYPPVFHWRCRLTQVDPYNGREMTAVVGGLFLSSVLWRCWFGSRKGILVLARPGSPGKRAVKRVSEGVCALSFLCFVWIWWQELGPLYASTFLPKHISGIQPSLQ